MHKRICIFYLQDACSICLCLCACGFKSRHVYLENKWSIKTSCCYCQQWLQLLLLLLVQFLFAISKLLLPFYLCGHRHFGNLPICLLNCSSTTLCTLYVIYTSSYSLLHSSSCLFSTPTLLCSCTASSLTRRSA